MLEDVIEKYEGLRKQCFEAAKNDPALLGDSQWLKTAFSNAGPEGIYMMEATEEGIKCWSSCWTSQTGGSNEFIEFTVPLEALAG